MVVKFLIVRFSSIGDIVLTTPVIRCLKEQFDSELEIHYITKKSFAAIVESNPHIDKVYSIDKSTSEIIEELNEEHYHYIIDLHNNLRSGLLKRKLKTVTFSFNKLNIEKWLRVNLNIDRLPKDHIVDRYLKCLDVFDIKNDNKGLDFFIPEKDNISIASLPVSHHSGYVGLVIGGTYFTKKLPQKKLIEICQRIGGPIVLLGGPDDQEIGSEIARMVGPSIYNACGNYTLNQSASLVRQANVIITHDTGLMHIAAAFNKKTISIWGNTIPEFGMTPYIPQAPELSIIKEISGLRCRPCSKLGFDKCPKKHFYCMETIDVDEIVNDI